MYDWKHNPYNITDNLAREIRDLDFNFGKHPLSGDLRKKKNVEAIKQSIRTLVYLNHYEKPFHPDIGTDIYKSLFELMYDDAQYTILESDIKKMISEHEPRADIQHVKIVADNDNNALAMSVYFIPEGDTQTHNVDLFLRVQR